MDLPLPSPGTNGFMVNAMTGGANAFNQVQQGQLANQLLGQQNQYYGPLTQAQIQLAQTQARFMPTMYTASMLSNPVFLSTLASTPEGRQQLQALTQQAMNGLSTPQNSNGYMPQPQQNGLFGAISNSPMGSLYRYITGGSNQQSQQNSLNQPIYGTASTANYARPASDVTTYATGAPNTQVTQSGQGVNNPPNNNTVAPPNNALGAYYGLSRGQQEAKSSGTNIANQWKALTDQASDEAQFGNDLGNYATGFKNSYNNSTYVGPHLGSLPSKGLLSPPTWPGTDLTPEQTADNYQQNMQAKVAQELAKNGGGRLTNQMLKFAAGLKMERPMTQGAMNNVYNVISSVQNRTQEKVQFLNRMQDLAQQGYDIQPKDAEAMWGLYNKQLPPYNPTTSTANNYDGKWQEYATPQALQSLKQNGTYESPTYQQLTNQVAPRNNGSYVPSQAQSSVNALASTPQAINNGLAQVNLSGASKNLARTAQWPDFSKQGKSAARAWYSRQPATVQKAYLAYLSGNQ